MTDKDRAASLRYRTKPMTLKEVYDATDQGNKDLKVVILLDMQEIACSSSDNSLDGLNELADREIGHCLLDLSYVTLGVEFDHEGKSTGGLYIEVTGDASEVVFDYEESVEQQRRDEKNGLHLEHIDDAN